MDDSVFTKIVRGEIPADIIYEDELTMAFLDINPVTKGHTLVIPKQQIDQLDDCPPEIYAAIFNTVHKISKLLKTKLEPKRIVLVVFGFDVPHAHVHLIPAYSATDVKFPERQQREPDHDELAALANELQA